MFLVVSGGNWGVTKALKASALAAPFEVRCGDPALQPLQLRRRSKWYARSGKNREARFQESFSFQIQYLFDITYCYLLGTILDMYECLVSLQVNS